MSFWLRLSRAVDKASNWLGQLTGWLTFAMVLIGAYNAVVRYCGRFFGWNLSSNAYIETQWYLFGTIFLLAASWTLREDRHVRVDVIYSRLGDRARAWIDLLGILLMLVPFCLFALWTSWPLVHNSWVVREVSPDPGGLPRYPIKTLIPVAFFLLLLQGLSEAVKRVALLTGHEDPAIHRPGGSL